MRLFKTFMMTTALIYGANAASAHLVTGAGLYVQAQSHQTSLVTSVNFDPAVTAKQAEKTIRDLGDKAISTLETETSDVKRAEVFKSVLNNNFDMETIARFSLGRYWSVATPAEQAEYTKLFKDMVVDVYSQRFEDYSGQKFNVTGSKHVGRNDTIVNSVIVSPSGQAPVKVDWRMRDGKIIDVVVEGVSMSVTQRSEFNSIIQRNGGKVSALINHLKK